MTETRTDPFSVVLEQATAIAERLPRPALDADEAESVDMMVESVRAWAERNIDSAAIDEAADVDPTVYQSAAELGLFGLTVPEPHGGAGFSLSAAARIIEEVATFDRSVATSIGLHCGLGLRGLIHFGSAELKERYLPSLATGERIAAFAATEPDAGSHIAGVKTVAKWDGNTGLMVNGSKCFVTNGAIADVFTILAKTPGLGGARRGYSLLLMTKAMPGIDVGAEEHKLGIRGSSTTTLSFDDVEVDTSQVIGEPSKGLDLMNEVLAWGRTLMSAGCLGSAREAYNRAAAYVLDRRQFGKPIGAFGLVREKVATMRARLYATESLVRLTTLLQSAYDSDIIWESSIAKVFASESTWQITDDALQVHGGAG
ncbi:acyl-CoA dehydrogenase family protein, partial [Myxococcota bacterium]